MKYGIFVRVFCVCACASPKESTAAVRSIIQSKRRFKRNGSFTAKEMAEIVDRAERLTIAAQEACTANSVARARAMIASAMRREAAQKVPEMRAMLMKRALDVCNERVELATRLCKLHTSLTSTMPSGWGRGDSGDDSDAVGKLVVGLNRSSSVDASTTGGAFTKAHLELCAWVEAADAGCVMPLPAHPWNSVFSQEAFVLFTKTLGDDELLYHDDEGSSDEDDDVHHRRAAAQNRSRALAAVSPVQKMTDDDYLDIVVLPRLTPDLLRTALMTQQDDESSAAAAPQALLREYVDVVAERLAIRLAMQDLRSDPKVCIMTTASKAKRQAVIAAALTKQKEDLASHGGAKKPETLLSCPPLVLTSAPDSLPMCLSQVYHALLIKCCARDGLDATLTELEALSGCTIDHDHRRDNRRDSGGVIDVDTSSDDDVSIVQPQRGPTLVGSQQQGSSSLDSGVVHYLVECVLAPLRQLLSQPQGDPAAARRVQKAIKHLQ